MTRKNTGRDTVILLTVAMLGLVFINTNIALGNLSSIFEPPQVPGEISDSFGSGTLFSGLGIELADPRVQCDVALEYYSQFCTIERSCEEQGNGQYLITGTGCPGGAWISVGGDATANAPMLFDEQAYLGCVLGDGNENNVYLPTGFEGGECQINPPDVIEEEAEEMAGESMEEETTIEDIFLGTLLTDTFESQESTEEESDSTAGIIWFVVIGAIALIVMVMFFKGRRGR